jgi:hypothetical protein
MAQGVGGSPKCGKLLRMSYGTRYIRKAMLLSMLLSLISSCLTFTGNVTIELRFTPRKCYAICASYAVASHVVHTMHNEAIARACADVCHTTSPTHVAVLHGPQLRPTVEQRRARRLAALCQAVQELF